MKHGFLMYLFLTLTLFNALFLMQLLFGYLPMLTLAEQWVVVGLIFFLLIFGIINIERKKGIHFSRHELSLFQILFFLFLTIHGALLLLLLVIKPIVFLIFMPFEFFVIAYLVGYYFLLVRHIIPHNHHTISL